MTSKCELLRSNSSKTLIFKFRFVQLNESSLKEINLYNIGTFCCFNVHVEFFGYHSRVKLDQLMDTGLGHLFDTY